MSERPTRRLRLIVSAEYDADPEDYGTDDPTEMAAIDAENFSRIAPDHLLYLYFTDERVTLTVEAVSGA